MSKNKNIRNAAILTAGLAAVGGGLAIAEGSEKPVDSKTAAALAAQYAGKIARIPVTDAELAAVKADIKDFPIEDKTSRQTRIDKATGQPYHIPNSEDPNRAQVVRIIAARDGSGVYKFIINEQLNNKGELDQSHPAYVDAEISKGSSGIKNGHSAAIYDLGREPDNPALVGETVEAGDDWGAETQSGPYIVAEMSADSEMPADRVLTADRLKDVDIFMSQAVDGAATGASVNSIQVPDSLQLKK